MWGGTVHPPPAQVAHVFPTLVAEMPLRALFDTPRWSHHTALDARPRGCHPARLADVVTGAEGVRIEISGGAALDARAVGKADRVAVGVGAVMSSA